MSPPLERDAEDRFVQWIESLGFEAWKLRIDGRDGFPDRTVVTDQGTAFFEFKRPGGKLRPQQRQLIRRLGELEAPVFVVHSLKEAKDQFHEWYGRQAEGTDVSCGRPPWKPRRRSEEDCE